MHPSHDDHLIETVSRAAARAAIRKWRLPASLLEDATQTAVLGLLKQRSTVESSQKPRAYLFVSARNAVNRFFAAEAAYRSTHLQEAENVT